MRGAAQEVPTFDAVGALFAERCVMCHSGEDVPLGLRPDTHENALKGPPFLEPAQIALVEAWVMAKLPAGNRAPAPGEPVLWADIEPVLNKACVKCHSDKSKLGAPPKGLRLSSLPQVLAGSDRLLVLPGIPEMPELWRRVMGLASPRMPFDGPRWLPDEDIRLIQDWIAQGARDAEGNPAPVPVGAQICLRGTLTDDAKIDGAGRRHSSRGPFPRPVRTWTRH